MTLSEPFDITRGVIQGDIFSRVALGVGESTTITSKFEYVDGAALMDADAATATARVAALMQQW